MGRKSGAREYRRRLLLLCPGPFVAPAIRCPEAMEFYDEPVGPDGCEVLFAIPLALPHFAVTVHGPGRFQAAFAISLVPVFGRSDSGWRVVMA